MNGGEIDATNNKTVGSAVVNYGGTVIINDGTLSASLDVVHAEAFYANDAVVEVKGGTLNPKDDWSAGIMVGGANNNGSVKATISGGTVNGQYPLYVDTSVGKVDVKVTGGSFSSDVSGYVKDGLELVQGADGSYTVSLPAAAAPIPETGDGMGLFVFAGLALISMLGMVVLKKREQN